MIDQTVGNFLKFSFEEKIQQKFFRFIFDYVDYVLPVLIKGNHTADNEMQCCASQSLHLSYSPSNREDVNFIYYRNEQGTGMILKVTKNEFNYEIKPYWVAKPLTKEINSKTLKELRYKIRSNYARLVQEASTAKEFATSPDSFKNPIFSIQKWTLGEERIMVDSRSHIYNFKDQLEVFGMMNSMVCGVSSHIGEENPKSFDKHWDEANALMDKLRAVLE